MPSGNQLTGLVADCLLQALQESKLDPLFVPGPSGSPFPQCDASPLPDGTRFVIPRGDYHLFAIERSPALPELDFSQLGLGRLRLGFPIIWHLVTVGLLPAPLPVSHQVLFARKPLRTPAGGRTGEALRSAIRAYTVPLPNFKPNSFGTLCAELPARELDVNGIVRDAVAAFYFAPFTREFASQVGGYTRKGEGLDDWLLRWAAGTRASGSGFAEAFRWRHAGFSLEDAVQATLSRFPRRSDGDHSGWLAADEAAGRLAPALARHLAVRLKNPAITRTDALQPVDWLVARLEEILPRCVAMTVSESPRGRREGGS